MKKLLQNSLLLLLCMIVGASSAWADNTYTLGWGTASGDAGTYTNFTAISGTVTNIVSFSAARNSSGSNPAYNSSASELRLYYHNSGAGGSVTLTPAAGVTITGFVMTTSTTPNVKYKVNGGAATSVSASSSSYTVTGISATSSLEIQNVNTSNTQLRIKTIQITYTTAAPAYTITAQSNNTDYGTVSLSGSVITGSPKSGCRYASPAYTVDPANSATVAQDGNAFTVTPSANTTVTINFEAIPKYTVTLGDDSSNLTEESAGAGVTLPTRSTLNGYAFAGWSATNVSSETTTAPTIIPAGSYTPTANITLYPVYTKTVGGGGVSHESASVTISDYANANSWANSSRYTSITLDENVTVSGKDNGNNSKYYSSSPGTWRHYAGDSGEITISTTNGELTSVTLTYTGNTINYGDNDVESGTAITVSGASAVFTVSGSSGNSQISAISVNYDVTGAGTTYYWSAPVAAAVEMPSIVIAENPFLFSTTATITCTTDGAAIKYSYDGENWSDYSSALTITETKTIYAKAVKNTDESSVAQETATKNLAEPTVTVSGDLTLDLDGETNVAAGTLTAAVTYNEAAVAGAVVTWTSNNTDVATINAETGAVTIKTTGTVTFTATYAGNSDYAEATGTKTVTVINSKVPGSLAMPYTVAQARDAIDAGTGITDVYVTGKISQIDGYNSNYHSITYWISSDGNTTGDQLEVYSGKGLNNANFSAVTDLQVGDVVVVYGTLKKYNEIYEFDKNNYIVSRTELPASDLTKTSDITLDFKNGATDANLTSYFTTSSAGAISYTVADETVIERADELISALKVGTTTVTVSQAATLSYKAGEIVINVTVQDTREAATTIPAINISTLKVGNDGKISVVNPVKADEGVTFAYVSSDENVLLIADEDYEALDLGTVTVTVTATPSNTNLYKPVVANFEVTVEADVKTDTEITLDATSGSTVYGTTKSVGFTITAGYDGTMGYTIDNAAIADVEIGANTITFTPKAVGTAVVTISASESASFNAAADVEYTLMVTAPAGGETAAVSSIALFSETFDKCDGNGGRDGEFTGSIGTSSTSGKLDEEWATIGSNGASKCIKLGTGNNAGSVETSAITLNGNGTLTYAAAGWGDTKTNIVQVTATGCTLSGDTEVELVASTWKTYTVNITDVTDVVAITFTMKRGFLDDVVIETAGVTIQTTLNASGYATFCSQYPLDFTTTDGYTAWQIKEISGETITFEKITGKIKGGQGILLKGEANETITLASSNSDNVLASNLLVGTMAPVYTTAAGEYYGLYGDKFVRVNAGTVPAGKALLPASTIPSTARELTFVFEDGETTGISTIAKSQKLNANGYYDLLGRKVEKPVKGLYIKNGKKVIVK